MKTEHLTCISCPMGCSLTVQINDNNEIQVTGNTCKRGEIYGQKEVTNPTRIVTSTVEVIGGNARMVSVKTAADIPKSKVMDCLKALKTVKAYAPIKIGDVIAENIADTKIPIIATKNVATTGIK